MLGRVRVSFLVAFSQREQFGMARWKDIVADEREAFIAETAPRSLPPIPLEELTKILGIDDLSFQPDSLDDTAFEPAAVDPPLHLFGTDVQNCGQGALSKPFAAPSSAAFKAVQHRPDRARRPAHDSGPF